MCKQDNFLKFHESKSATDCTFCKSKSLFILAETYDIPSNNKIYKIKTSVPYLNGFTITLPNTFIYTLLYMDNLLLYMSILREV